MSVYFYQKTLEDLISKSNNISHVMNDIKQDKIFMSEICLNEEIIILNKLHDLFLSKKIEYLQSEVDRLVNLLATERGYPT